MANQRGRACGRGRLGHYCDENWKLSITNYDYEYWPFPLSDAEAADPEFADKVAFLKEASEAGAESYKFGINNYGAKSKHRSGIILERGRRRWEVRLSQDNVRRVSAFVSCFSFAGIAVNSWLRGGTISQILDELNEHLIVPPGLKESYTIYVAEEE
jgi:hypothetical protein